MHRTATVQRRWRSGRVLAASTSVFATFLASALAAQRVDVQALDAYFARAQAEWPVPGVSVAIVKDGRIVLERGHGVRNVQAAESVDQNTLYAIASNSKAFTAAALAQQVDAGRLSWNDRVIDHLPYFRLYDDYVTQEIRVRDLLSHRSGLGTCSATCSGTARRTPPRKSCGGRATRHWHSRSVTATAIPT
jgi:CubicO group peptidase (beta-lactamase class C family)